MAFLPVNAFFAALFLVGIIWGWEGQLERQFMAVISSIFMFPLWLLPLYSILQTTSGTIIVTTTNGWLPTGILENVLFWNVVLMYFTGAHMMESLNREEPVGRALKRLRKS